MTRNIFVLGPDDFQLRQLRSIRGADELRFHPLLDKRDVAHAHGRYDMPALLSEGIATLESFDGAVDGIVGFWDFPTSALLPLLRRPFELPGPSLEQVLRCEHKHWSRKLQREAIGGDHVPACAPVDPFTELAGAGIDLDFPFWLKPVKAHSSYLGFRIHDRAELQRALGQIRAGIARFGDPFDWTLEQVDVPEEVRRVGGYCCVAEAMIGGRQCTAEGWVRGDDVEVYGIVDSRRETGRSSFSRYQYPSVLPDEVQSEIVELSTRVIRHIGLEDSCFNIEFFWDEPKERLWLLEINARCSNSHAPLFRRVDGASHQGVAVQIALGERPRFPRARGDFEMAAKFMYRRYKDAWVKRLPTTAEIETVEHEIPGTEVTVSAREARHLSELVEQDAYSYEILQVFLGGDSEAELLHRYDDVMHRLRLELIETPNGR